MNKRFFRLAILLSLIFYACNHAEENVEEVLKQAGANRPELEKVIEHYKELGDKEKLKAAYFLIGNMQNKYGRQGDFVKNFYPVFDKLRELTNQKVDKDTIEKIVTSDLDAIEKSVGPITTENYPTYFDCNIITASYLIENIDYSFKAWKEKTWARHLNFDQFCEYILPYRMYDEPLQPFRKRFFDEFAWLQDSLKDKSDPLEACVILNRYLAKNFIYCEKLDRCPVMGINDLYKLKAGICEHRYYLITSIMRSVGIPVSLETTPQWTRYLGNHPWLVTIDKKGRAQPFNGGEPDVSFPDSVYVPLGKRGGTTKVYRITYALQKNSLISQLPPKDIPTTFKNPNMVDVTDEYGFPQANLKFDLKIKPPKGTKYVFLCGFGISYHMVPIAYVKYSSTVVFPHVGTNAAYFPAYCSNDKFIIAANLHACRENGTLEPMTPNFSKRVSIKLTRKFTAGGTEFDFAQWMVGAKLQASDNKEFKNPVTLFTIDKAYFYFVEKDIHLDKPYRYYRYLSSDSGKVRIAEVDFIPSDIENAFDKSKKFKIFGHIKDDGKIGSPNFDNAFDGNIATNFNAPAGSWVAIDFGKPVKISKLRFLLRNDLNVIEVGDEYELLYFDMGWKSLGKQIAGHNYIIFSKVPDNALLLLRDLTKGKEERVFTYNKEQEAQWWW